MGQDALDTEKLGRHIEETVMRLASLRAGYAIKDMPAPFAEIVEQLVRRISKEAGGGTLQLNPADLAVVQPLLENRDGFSQISFKADDAICRAIFAYRLVRLRLKTGSINVPALAWMVKAKEQNLMRLDASCVIC